MLCDFKIKQVSTPFYAKQILFPIKILENTPCFKVLEKGNIKFNSDNTTPKFKLSKVCCKR